MLTESIRRAIRALIETPLRTTLTLAGIAIGIGALFSLLSIAEGIRTRIVNEWLSSGLMTSLSVMPQGTPNPMRGGRSGRRPGSRPARISGEDRRALDDAAAAGIAAIAGVRRVWPVIARPVLLIGGHHAEEGNAAPRAESTPIPDGKPSRESTQVAASADPRAPQSTGGTNPDNQSAAPSSSAPKSESVPAPQSEGSAATPRAGPSGESPKVPEQDAIPGAQLADSGTHGANPATEARAASGESDDAEYTTLRGFDTDFFWGEDYLKIVAGGPLTDASAAQALVSDDHLKSLGFTDAASAVGRSVRVRWREPVPDGTQGAEGVPGMPLFVALRTREFRIVGVFERRGALALRSTGLIVPTAQAKLIATLDMQRLRSVFEGDSPGAGYPGLDVYLTPGADLEAVESKIKEMGFETLSGAAIVSQIRRSILVLQAILGGLGTIAIAVASLGIANTLLTAVYERMREIGVMKAVGARRKDIRRQFFAEAGLIGFTGGLAGLILGFLADHILALVIGQIVKRQGGQDPGAFAVHTPAIALGCLAFSVGLSLLAGTLPAARAARLDPVLTLRHE